MEKDLILRNHLKEIRSEKGLSQQELAHIVGVSRNTISSIETLQFSPTAKLALIICIALDKKFEDIFSNSTKNPQIILRVKGGNGQIYLINQLKSFP